MKVHRTKHTANFTIAPNAILREERMSEMARLILLRLLSNADGYEGATALKMWEDARAIRGDAAPGKRAFLNAFNEMEEFGYLVRTKVREGSKWVTHVDVYDTPQGQVEEDTEDDSLGLPGFGKPEPEKSEPGKSETGQSSKRTTEKDVSRRTISSSSAEVEDITHDVVPTVPKKKTKIETSSEIIKRRLTEEHCTTTEADELARIIDRAGTNTGERIKSLPTWVTRRDINTLRGDLAQLRRFAAAPPIDGVCSEHDVSLAPGRCSSCEGDMNAGDFEVVRRILERDGEKARPDLARLLGTPVTPVGATTGGWSWENQLRGERRARSGHTP